ncbi:MAG: hypothetical protein WD844_17280 [Thermoleophilaceae bacterium]
MLAAVVDWEGILEVIVVSFVAGVGVTAIYAVAVLGATRVLDMTRDGRTMEAGAYAVLAVAAFAVVLAACAFGIVVLTQ